MTERYYLDSDDDDHWYVIPVDKRSEWDRWCCDPEETEWTPPEWASPVNGHPSLISFTDWTHE